MPNNRLFLLDAYALIYRAYFAFSKPYKSGADSGGLFNSKGVNTGPIYGFTNTLLDILTKENPSHIAVCFDTAAPTERHTDFADYKANRQEQPEDITRAIPYIKEIIRAFKIPCVEKDGFEADDVIGTLAKQAEKKGYRVYMVTPDKDYGQLVSENIFMYKPPYQGGEYEILDEEKIKAKWEIDDVNKVIDILGLMGDSIDNIPGLPGVGEKTAKKLVQQFGSIENLVERTEELKGKLQQTVIENKELALLSKKLATIILNVPVEFDEKDFEREEPDKIKLNELFNELEFRSLGRRIIGEGFSLGQSVPAQQKQTDLFGNAVEEKKQIPAPTEIQASESIIANTADSTPHEYHLVDTEEKISGLVKLLEKTIAFCFDTETTDIDANRGEAVGLAFSIKTGEGYYVPVPADQVEAKKIIDFFKPVLENENILKIGQNLKYDMLVLKWYGVEVKGRSYDTMIAHYLIDADLRHNMDFLSETYLKYKPISIETLIGKKGKAQKTMRDAPVEAVKEYSAEDADVTLQLKELFTPMLKEKQAEKLFEEVEMPLVKVLTDMEFEGVKIDEDFLRNYSKELQLDIVKTEKEVYELAGVRFNLSSPKQLGEVLFDKLKINHSGKKTRTGQYSTDEDMLSKLANEHPIADKLLNYRELTKLKSTYVDSLPDLINPKTGRVHTTFAQAVASTGRLSSNNPNLQNIPIRTERGREIRKAFIARDENHILVSADYSQIELRIIAAISKEKNMIHDFEQGLDIHAATAARIYNTDLNSVDKDMRRNAKTVNFGIIYCISPFGLSQQLSISRGDAALLIQQYFTQYPAIKTYMEETIAKARKQGYVETVLGRRRYLKDINSNNQNVRSFAERISINAPIQGSAADMIKVAMINIHDEIVKRKFRSRMTLQVHDELVFDVHKEELDEIRPIILDKMRHAIPLEVPIEVEAGTGTNWLEAH